ncbi:hypothetical protein SAMN04487995_5950 [Dyadobacter koreensis]|uniref:Uncharacterized protein n=1 Tax=Dyadobacter koreensis TaxID=408657 RepID=A0A1H7AU06_9BACT|nr:hypothetical protein [Dyadobacter koreensis]SEJ69083.1 hypothetical protein SAMN04487995_5950 [Dyadobacter koreensis]
MKHKYTPSSRRKDWIQISILAILLGLATQLRAQEGTQGNTTVFGGAQMTFFGNHNFVTGGGGAQPGVILTERATGNFGILSFSGDNLTSTGISNTGYVDGYVKKYGAGQFIFPVGDNGNDGPFAASADGTMGAYFRANPATAITSNLFTGGNYPVLPSGGPFPTGMTTRGPGIKAVSNVEYWDIDGANATPITLTWDAGSNVATLTASVLSSLTIVGWNGQAWVRIPSTVDATSILGGTSAVNSGSITTTAPIVPDTYLAYTLAGLGPDLTPRITVVPGSTHGIQVLEVLVAVQEVGSVVASTGQITVRVAKSPLLSNFIWNQAQTTAPSNGNISVQNNIWTSSQDANYYIFTTTTSIPRASQRRLVFYLTMNPGGGDGSFPLPVTIPAGQGGGEVNLLNNQDTDIIQFFAN